jgi:CRISPR system Cascade subunit CasA
MTDPSFNIIDKPVFLVLMEDNQVQELSLAEMFSESKRIIRIVGESPLQEFAITRILLSILYRSLKGPADVEEWLNLWEEGIPQQKILDYLHQHYDRFDLLHPVTPFYQIAGAEYKDAKKAPSNLSLILDMQKAKEESDGTQRFISSSYTNTGLKKLSFSEAARRVIELQNYNVASKRAVIKDDPRKKKYRYAQMGWAGNISGILLIGNNFHQTLLLNLIPTDRFPEVDFELDLPVWEREVQTAAPEGLHGDMDESRPPTGPSDLYTSQGSRITLHNDGSHVIGAVVGIGDRLFKYDQHLYEPLSSWRKITRKETKKEVFTPITINSSQVWRGLESILALDPKVTQIVAKNIDFFNEVEAEIDDTISSIARIATYEVAYGPQDAVIEEVMSSQLVLPASILASKDIASLQLVVNATNVAKEVGKIIQRLHVDILVAEGKERKPVKGVSPYIIAQKDAEAFLHDVGSDFQNWVSEVTPENCYDKFEQWLAFVNKKAYRYGEETSNNISTRALQGVQEEGQKQRTNIFTALKQYNKNINEITKNTGATK